MQKDTLILQKYQGSDFGLFCSLVQNDQVMKYVSLQGLTLEQARTKFTTDLQINAQYEQLGFFKVYNKNGDFVGHGKLEWSKNEKDKLEIGYIFKQEHWGKGYGTQVCEMLLAIAEQHFVGIDIIGIIDPQNTASRRILEKFGFISYFVGQLEELPTEKLLLKR